MSELNGAIEVSIKPKPKQHINKVCADAKLLSEYINRDIVFEFNGVRITTENKSINEMVDSYMYAR